MRNRVLASCVFLAVLAAGWASRASAQALPSGVTAPPVQGDPGISAMWRLLDDSAFSVARD